MLEQLPDRVRGPRGRPALDRWLAPVLALAALLLTVALLQLEPGFSGKPWSWPAVAQAQAVERSVPLRIARNRSGGVLAFVPVYINQQGPYYFALDTGASHTVVDLKLADQLGLEDAGLAGSVQGVAGTAAARTVRIQSWRLDQVELPPSVAVRLDLPELSRRDPFTPAAALDPVQAGPRGLLGSDLLSGFGAVTIDYDASQLKLASRGS